MGNSHGHFVSLTISRLWEMVGNSQIERVFRETVGNSHFNIIQIFAKWSGNSHFSRSNNELLSGNSGKQSFERD